MALGWGRHGAEVSALPQSLWTPSQSIPFLHQACFPSVKWQEEPGPGSPLESVLEQEWRGLHGPPRPLLLQQSGFFH